MGTTSITAVYLKGSSVNLCDDGGNVTIGKGDGTSVITMRSPITIGYSYPITGNKIGEIIQSSYTQKTIPNNSTISLGEFNLPSAGVYSLSGSIYLSTGSAGNMTIIQVYWINSTFDTVYGVIEHFGGTGESRGLNHSVIISCPANSYIRWNTVIQYSGTTVTTNSIYYSVLAVRIA
jgi:hypothetical protein